MFVRETACFYSTGCLRIVSEANAPVFTHIFSIPPPSSQPMKTHKHIFFYALSWNGCIILQKNNLFFFFIPYPKSRPTNIRFKNASTPMGFSFTQPPTGREYAGRGWRSRFIVRNEERFPLPIRPPVCCSGCPHRAEVSLWLPLGLSATEIPAPDAAPCLPSPVTVFRFTPTGRLVFAKLIIRRNLFKGMPFKAAAYWYSVVKVPTFRRKAYL